ncbi:MAG: hypothetical protein MK171_05455 [Pirellulales bacterium]|nr:hypothetical protein [Pirellulales bacterium]
MQRKSQEHVEGCFGEIERLDETARVVVDSVDVAGCYINEADAQLALIRPGLEREDTDLGQTAPGWSERECDTEKSEAYHSERYQRRNDVAMFQ